MNVLDIVATVYVDVMNIRKTVRRVNRYRTKNRKQI